MSSSARHTIAMIILVSLLTLDFHCSEAYKLPLTRLRKRQRTLFRRDNDENPRTFEEPKCLSTIKTDGISIVNYGISYLNSSIEISGRFYEALKDLYNSDKQVMKTIVYETLEKYDKYDYSYYNHLFNDTLEKAIIGPYTNMLYRSVNQLLRKHDCGKTKLTETEKYSGPYVAYLMAVLMYSNKLTPEDNSTYRIVYFEDDITDQYQVGTTFVWTSFTSSSVKNIMFFGNTEFVFNNSQTSLVSPKRIEQYSWYEVEAEALYPPTAMFRVTAKENKGTKIYADLVTDI
ncbi:uncharacterized protein LOC144620933 [Crassostrea virginica]